MAFTDDQVMLTLAGLTYRGFHDVLPGRQHDENVRAAVADGLAALAPVRDDWELVWGPATHDEALFDSTAMYVARHRHAPGRYVLAIRGTNPVSAADWLFGDLLAWTTVPWPYASDGAAVSTSTALGLVRLLGLRARPAPAGSTTAPASGLDALARRVGHALAGALPRLFGTGGKAAGALDALLRSVSPSWNPDTLLEKLRARSSEKLPAVRLERKAPQPAGGDTEMDLLTFLRREAERAATPLDVAVTGHSKGGALAPGLALWLEDELAVAPASERWDAGRAARVRCYAFAGPTPGNAAFAARIDTVLGSRHHHLRNMNDIVTRAWDESDLREIPGLYGSRTAAFAKLVDAIVEGVRHVGYRQAREGVTRFHGPLSDGPFVAEFVHQHLDAYLERLELLGTEINALTLFV